VCLTVSQQSENVDIVVLINTHNMMSVVKIDFFTTKCYKSQMSFLATSMIESYEKWEITERWFIFIACEYCNDDMIAYAYDHKMQFQPLDLIKICKINPHTCNAILIRDNLRDDEYVNYHDTEYIFYYFCFIGNANTKVILRMLLPYVCKRKTRNTFVCLRDMFEMNDVLKKGMQFSKQGRNVNATSFLKQFVDKNAETHGRIPHNEILILFNGTHQNISTMILLYDNDLVKIGEHGDDKSVERFAKSAPTKRSLLLRGAIFANNYERVINLLEMGTQFDGVTVEHINITKKEII